MLKAKRTGATLLLISRAPETNPLSNEAPMRQVKLVSAAGASLPGDKLAAL